MDKTYAVLGSPKITLQQGVNETLTWLRTQPGFKPTPVSSPAHHPLTRPPLPDIPTFLRILEYCPARHAGAPRPVDPGRRGLAAPLTVAGPLLLLPQAVI